MKKWGRIDILDDDSTVHDRWSAMLSSNEIKMSNFLDVSSYFAWKKQRRDDSNCLNIIDFDLNDSKINGIEVIKKVGSKNTILVTNNFCEKSIQDSVEKNNIQMMPKSMMEMI